MSHWTVTNSVRGRSGLPGPKGDKGDQGNVGATGSQGPIGNTGATGGIGAQGPIGLTGAIGPTGLTGATGGIGPAGPAIVSAPTVLTPAFGTAYPTAVPAKPSFISAVIDAAYTVTVLGTQSDTVELRVGPVQATVANGTGGVRVASFRASVTGIALVIGMGLGQGNQISGWVPAGYYWAIRRVAGTAATITSAIEQTLG